MFRNRSLAAGSLNLFLVFAVMFGIFLVLIQFLQAVLGFSALKASAGLLPMAAMMMPLSSVAPTLAKKFGTTRVLITGSLIFGLGLVLLATMVSVEGGYLSLLPGLMVFGVGVGLLMSPSTAAITEALPAEKQGVASALNDTVRELGGAIGIALLGSLINSGYRSSVSSATEGLSPELAHQVEDGIGSALAAGPKLGADGPAILDAAREALVEGWQHADVVRRGPGRHRLGLPDRAWTPRQRHGHRRQRRRRPSRRRPRARQRLTFARSAPTKCELSMRISASRAHTSRVSGVEVRLAFVPAVDAAVRLARRCSRPVRSAHASNTSVKPGGTGSEQREHERLASPAQPLARRTA